MKTPPVAYISILLAFLIMPILVGSVHAASLKFDKTTNTVNNGDTFDVQIVIDPLTEQVTSTDAYVIFDNAKLTLQSVKDGTYFPQMVNNTDTAGRVYVAGIVNDPTEFKTGTGTVATITFKAIATGSTNLTYLCSATGAETSKIIKNDINATNIIDCSTNGQQLITMNTAGSGGGGGTITPAPTTLPVTGPSATPTPSPTLTPTPSPTLTPTRTPTPTIASNSAIPTALPQSGTFENLLNIAIPGIVLLTMGGVLKILMGI